MQDIQWNGKFVRSLLFCKVLFILTYPLFYSPVKYVINFISLDSMCQWKKLNIIV